MKQRYNEYITLSYINIIIKAYFSYTYSIKNTMYLCKIIQNITFKESNFLEEKKHQIPTIPTCTN